MAAGTHAMEEDFDGCSFEELESAIDGVLSRILDMGFGDRRLPR